MKSTVDRFPPSAYNQKRRNSPALSSFLTKRQEADMELALALIMDELAPYKPVVHKMRSAEAEFRRFGYYDRECTETDPACLYVLDGTDSGSAGGKDGPRHVMVAADAIPGVLAKKTDAFDTFIQIPGGLSPAALLQAGYAIFESCETWYKALLLAIIQHKPINNFLEIASGKLTNPLALFDNRLAVISAAGEFSQSTRGTIWEKINNPAFVSIDFYTNQEQRNLSKYILEKTERPYVYYPSADPGHAYVTSCIWINDKLYGSIGMVDINAPFTGGQLFIIRHITHALTLYFQNNSIYMRIAENKINYLDSLLDGADISEDLVSRYLDRIKWKLKDDFCFLTFTSPVDLTTLIASVSYVKQLNSLFPKALISIYQNSIIMIVRYADYPARRDKERQQLEKLLIKNEMRCGVSMVFTNFMRLRYYYVQSSFAAAYSGKHPESPLCYYENCQRDHVLQSLAAAADLCAFCHPAILALQESGGERQQELVRCLYYYLLNGGNLATTAKALFVHRSTLIYRLERLSNILQCDLKKLSPDQTVFYLLSCTIARYGLS
jgi:hypothetical protein